MQINPPLTFGNYFLTPRDPRKRKLEGLVGSGNTSMAFEFGPNPTVRPEVISFGENTPGTGNRQIAGKNERGQINFMALMCSRPKLRKKTSSEQTLSVGSFQKSRIAIPGKGDNEPLKNDNSVSNNRV